MGRSTWQAFPRPLRVVIIAFAIVAILPALFASQYFLAVGDYDKSLSAEADAANRAVHYLRYIIAIPAACAGMTYIWARISVRLQIRRIADKSKSS